MRKQIGKPQARTRLTRTVATFAGSQAGGGVLLIVAAMAALAWANSPQYESYFQLWQMKLGIFAGRFQTPVTLGQWVNEGLMALFFLLVGLEIKREILMGELSNPKQATLAIGAAIGGMIVPATLYVALNFGSANARGWGIPMATDIAFSLGVLTLLGARVPPTLKVFLIAFAIVDDLAAVVVIAMFYTSRLDSGALGLAGVVLALLVLCNAVRIRSLGVYAALGILLWVAVSASGVHATVAGVLLAFTVPERAPLDSENSRAPLLRLELALQPWIALVVMPVFALANAGVRVLEIDVFGSAGKVTLGVMAGLLLGKPIGVLGACWLLVRLGLCELPRYVTWWHLFGVAVLGGIGFTMSLFIAALAFGNGPSLDAAKLGIVIASPLAAVAGCLILVKASKITATDKPG